jgi:hypothetical protein
VVLVLRGREPAQVHGSAVHALWVISHPDDIDPAEAAACDVVLAASRTWAEQRSAAWQRPVGVVLQCTDPDRFHPQAGSGEPALPHTAPTAPSAPSGPSGGMLFVGNSRGEHRPVVAAALASGLPFTMYGADWDGLVPPGTVQGNRIDNAALGAHYAAADVVLGDHLDPMRRHGFISNRIFDAVACGARVLTDRIADVEQLFPGSVRCFDTAADLAELARPPWAGFGDREARLRNARTVLAEHTFEVRAAELLDAVSPAVAARARRTLH